MSLLAARHVFAGRHHALTGALLALALSGCQTAPVRPGGSGTDALPASTAPPSPEVLARSAAQAELLARLPADADLTRLEEQYEEIALGHYLTWAGIRRALPSARPAPHTVPSKAPIEARPRGPAQINWTGGIEGTAPAPIRIDPMGSTKRAVHEDGGQ